MRLDELSSVFKSFSNDASKWYLVNISVAETHEIILQKNRPKKRGFESLIHSVVTIISQRGLSTKSDIYHLNEIANGLTVLKAHYLARWERQSCLTKAISKHFSTTHLSKQLDIEAGRRFIEGEIERVILERGSDFTPNDQKN